MNIVKQWNGCYCLDTGDSGGMVLRGIITSGLYGVCEWNCCETTEGDVVM